MSGDFDDSHPARKVRPEELVSILKKRNEDVPAVTNSVIAQEFPEVKPQTVRNNLDDLADEGEICRFSDGNTKVFWYPRTEDEGGTTKYSELIDDSIDWEAADVNLVPEEIAEEIASERLPYYRPQSFWSRMTHTSQLGVMVSFGLVILGIGGLVGDSLGIGQEASAQIFRSGLYFSLISMSGYILSIILDNLAARGHVTKDPISDFLDG